ncbi:MAG: hAT transposon family protein, partial [Cyanobacteria bacterium J06649_11]
SKTVAKSLSTSFEITKLVKYSPKRDSHLRKIHEIQAQEEAERECSKASTVRLFSETRWTVRAKSLESIYENYEALEDLWDWCSSQYKDRETKARVGGVQAQMRTFEYFFGLRLGILILRDSDNLSASLQAKDLYAAKAKHTANKTLATIKKLRTDRSFELFWDDVNLKAKKLDIDAPKLPRERRAPKLIEEYYGGGKAEPEFPNDPKSYYLQIYNDSIDCIMNAIDERFNQEDFKKYIKLEDLLLQAARGEDFSDVYNEVKKIYAKDFDYTRLEVQLKTLVEYCKDFEAKFTINSIAEILRENDAKDHLCEVYKLLKLLLVLPATNATSERTFSLMKIIKTYLRSTMKQERLNHLMVLYAYKDRLENLNLNKIANEFISKNDTRRLTFGKASF